MNKISKKIVSLITMAAFVLTLVPAAAFAAGPVDAGESSYTVAAADYNQLKVTVDCKAADGTDADNYTALRIIVKDAAGNSLADNDNVTVQGPGDSYGNTITGHAAVEKLASAAGVQPYAQEPVYEFSNVPGGTYTVEVYAQSAADAPFHKIAAEDAVVVYGVNDANRSEYGVIENGAVKAEEATTVDTAITTGFVVRDADGLPTTDDIDGTVIVWAEENGQPTNYVVFDAQKTQGLGAKNGATVKAPVNEKTTLDVTFTKAGTYKLYAGVASDGTITTAKNKPLVGTTTVTVNPKNVTPAKITGVSADIEEGTAQTVKNVVIPFKNGIGELDLTGTEFTYDGVNEITIKGKLVDEDGNPVQGKTITATTNKDSVVEMDNNADTDVTDQWGNFDITFVMQDKSNATLTLTVADTDLSYTIQITAAKATAETIDRTLTGGNVLAGTDSKYAATVYGNAATDPVYFTDAVQFAITDSEGDAITGPLTKDTDYKIEVRTVPNNPKATLSNADLELVWDSAAGAYTLAYTGASKDGSSYKTDLLEGKYEVRVALVGGKEDNATVTFNAVKFGKVQDTVLDITARDYDQSPANPNEEVMSVDDTITLGQQITVTAKYVDGNGIKVPANNVSFNFNGKAVSDWSKWNNVFATQRDIPANESLIGTTVKVVAFNTANKQLVEKTLTVADSYTDKSLEFSSDSGAISKDNKVNVTVVDANGKTQQVEGYMTAWVADQSNEDAKISVDVNKNGVHDVQNGKGSLTVYADQESTADIVVVVKAGTEAYYGTLEYTFGAEDALANRTVVMTIDSTEYVVNNKIITGDAAPYIDSNWRTMVPIRALAESFDAEVIWNQDDSTVTINFDGDTQIVMTVGETAYTVDGAEATMDTEPVNAGDRVYVPVRFAAEGLGFNVLPLYNEAGLTASVVFQK